MESDRAQKSGVILMTYGSATTSEHVAEYMQHIYRDKVPDGVVADFEERYRLVGGSPLVKITEQQAHALEKMLGDRYVVRAAMLHSKPFIQDVIRECKETGVEVLRGIILSPQFSSFIMDGYRDAFARAAENAGFPAGNISVAGPWPTESHFIKFLAQQIKLKLAHFKQSSPMSPIPIVFTTHSLPKRVVDKDPAYLDQLKATIDAVVKEVGDPKLDWRAGYQSAGHTPEEWLKPDLTDILAELRAAGRKQVLIVPIQFLADHLEILYDLDIAARKQCEEFGIEYHRTEIPNVDPLFVESLAATARDGQANL